MENTWVTIGKFTSKQWETSEQCSITLKRGIVNTVYTATSLSRPSVDSGPNKSSVSRFVFWEPLWCGHPVDIVSGPSVTGLTGFHCNHLVAGIPVDMVGGTSMGSFVGAAYAESADVNKMCQKVREWSLVRACHTGWVSYGLIIGLLREVVLFKTSVLLSVPLRSSLGTHALKTELRGLLSFVWRRKKIKNEISKSTEGRANSSFWEIVETAVFTKHVARWYDVLMTSTDASTFRLLTLFLIGSEILQFLQL